MDITAVRQAMATALANTGIQVSPYLLSNPTPPTIWVNPPGVAYDAAMARGLDIWDFKLQGFVPFTTDIGSQVTLDALCAPSGATSVKRLLEADGTLGGLISDLRVTKQSPGIPGDHAGMTLIFVEWEVEVYASP